MAAGVAAGVAAEAMVPRRPLSSGFLARPASSTERPLASSSGVGSGASGESAATPRQLASRQAATAGAALAAAIHASRPRCQVASSLAWVAASMTASAPEATFRGATVQRRHGRSAGVPPVTSVTSKPSRVGVTRSAVSEPLPPFSVPSLSSSSSITSRVCRGRRRAGGGSGKWPPKSSSARLAAW